MSRVSYNNEHRILSRYFHEISAYPLLQHEDELKLVRRMEQGDTDAATRLVQSNLSFVVKVANEYRTLGVPFEDLLNEGNLGLIEATKRYDPTKGTKFITYAIWWIRKSILKALADHSLVVRMPAYRRKKIYELKRAESALREGLGRIPTREEVASELAIKVTQVDRIRGMHLVETSLDKSFGDDNAGSLHEFLADDTLSVEDRMLGEEAGRLVAEAFRQLSKREQDVLGWRLALKGRSSLTLKQVAHKLGVSRERVRQIENEAKHRLRRFLAASARDCSLGRLSQTAYVAGLECRRT